MNIQKQLTAADIKYRRIDVRDICKRYPSFFPNKTDYNVKNVGIINITNDFELHTDVGIIDTNVRKSTYRIGKGMKNWFDSHPEINDESIVEFDNTDGKCVLRISKI